MKRYTLKLAIAFLITYVLLMVVVVFAYTQISNNFIINQAERNLWKQERQSQTELTLKLILTMKNLMT